MLSNDILMPRIIRAAYPPESHAVEEIIAVLEVAVHPDAPQDVRMHAGRQAGLPIGYVNAECLPAVHRIIAAVNKVVGYSCKVDESSIRVQQPLLRWPRLSWHQDAAGMDLKPGEDAIIAWVPLNPIDGMRPSIEFADEQAGTLRHHGRDTALFLSADSSPHDKGTPVPNLAVGDIVLFSPLTLHRTYFAPGMTERRVSMDLRFYGSP